MLGAWMKISQLGEQNSAGQFAEDWYSEHLS
jgi:hypothetical protein